MVPMLIFSAIASAAAVIGPIVVHRSMRRTMNDELARMRKDVSAELARVREELTTKSPAPAPEAAKPVPVAAPAPKPVEAAPKPAPAPKPAAPQTDEVPAEILAVITAAVAHFFGLNARIRSARMMPVAGASAWAQQGRVSIHASHVFAAHHRA